MTTKIQVPDMNDSVSRVTLAGQEYMIRFTWNETCRSWSFGLYDMNMKTLVNSIKIVPYSPMNYFYKTRGLPDVRLYFCQKGGGTQGFPDRGRGVYLYPGRRPGRLGSRGGI